MHEIGRKRTGQKVFSHPDDCNVVNNVFSFFTIYKSNKSITINYYLYMIKADDTVDELSMLRLDN